MSKMSRLDVLESQAIEILASSEIPLKSQPTVAVDKHQQSYGLDDSATMARVIDFAADTNQIDPNRLMGLHIEVTTEDMADSDGIMFNDVRFLNSRVVFPVIRLRPDMKTKRANSVMKHELRHIFQPTAVQPYNDPSIFVEIENKMTAGLLGLGAAAIMAGQLDSDVGLNAVGIAFMSTAARTGRFVSSLLTPDEIHRFSPQEIDADLYALRYRRFQPLIAK